MIAPPPSPAERYHTLDAMRGVAAIAVVAFHISYPGYAPVYFGFLAVDFFFALSGFVVATAYTNALTNGLGFAGFAVKRVIRLYPMYLVGLAIGMAVWQADWWSVLLNAFMMPTLTNAAMYPMNGAHWSLFDELAANLAFALLLWRLPTKVLIAFVPICAIAFATLAVRLGTVNAGWYWTEAPFGLTRVMYPFIAGMVFARFDLQRRTSIWAIVAVLALAAALMLPLHGRLAYGLVFALVITPLLLLAGIRLELPRACWPLAIWLADVSYPMYCIHWPLIDIRARADALFDWSPTVRAAAFVAVNLMLARLALRYFDEPLRGWITTKRRMLKAG